MSNLYPHGREAVRVKVKKCDPNAPLEWRKFSVDPQITTLEILYSLLAKAFEVKCDFSLKYKVFDAAGNEQYLPLLSDWDLDAAFLRIHNTSIQTDSEPCLMLQIDVKPHTALKECDDSVPTAPKSSMARDLISPLQQTMGMPQKYVQHMQNKLPGLLMNQMEKTFNMMQKAFNISEEQIASVPPRAPLSDTEFRLFLDALGQIQRSDDLRKAIFFGGIDSSLRRVVWKHILNVYPGGMNGHQRMTYMRRKSEQYYKLREIWKNAIKNDCMAGELPYVTSMVKKDVLRTDRLHPFYAGHDDNQNITALFNILTTYALNHPSVSYCQGMSDIASPLLVTLNDEAQAYICFCAIMSRLRGNFMLDGVAMTQKFAHLTEALSYYDADFWEYLKSQQADDLLFCYRWLLLELKREFPFDDALRMLEVQWSSMKYDTNVVKELSLFEKEFDPNSAPINTDPVASLLNSEQNENTTKKSTETPYTKVCALRRQNSSASLSAIMNNRLDYTQRLYPSIDDSNLRLRRRRASSKAYQSMDETRIMELLASMEKVQENDDDEEDGVGDDDVFISLSETNNYFNFLPTNPFKEDAQLVLKRHEEITTKLISSTLLDKNNKTTTKINASEEKLKRTHSSGGGGHFKELKDKIAASRKVQNFEELNKRQTTKLVKSFKEFQNLATTKVMTAHNTLSSEDSELTDSLSRNRTPEDSIDSDKQLNCSEFEYEKLDKEAAGKKQIEATKSLNPFVDEVLMTANYDDEDAATALHNFIPTSHSTCSLPEVLLPISTAYASATAAADELATNATEEQPTVDILPEISEKLPLLASTSTGSRNYMLPPPTEFGGGNPFLMFLCLTLLLQHRNTIMKAGMDYNEIAMHFDKMVRKHDVTRVLNQARKMYIDYLKMQKQLQQQQRHNNDDNKRPMQD